jgi:hypothetical protein
MRLSPLGTQATNWPIVPAPDDRWWLWSSRWNENWQGKPNYSEKTCPSATWSTTNPTWPELGSNPGRRGGKSATNRLSYGTAICVILFFNSKLGPLGTSATEWSIVPAPGDYDDGESGGKKIGRGSRSTPRKPAPAPLCPPQIPFDQTRVRTRAAALGSQRLAAWAMARPWPSV